MNTLLFGLLRSQILLLYTGVTKGIASTKNADMRLSRTANIILSFVMSLPPLSLAIWYPYVGKLGALIAAFSTMFVIYMLPLVTFAKAVLVNELRRESVGANDDDQSQSKIVDLEEETNSHFQRIQFKE